MTLGIGLAMQTVLTEAMLQTGMLRGALGGLLLALAVGALGGTVLPHRMLGVLSRWRRNPVGDGRTQMELATALGSAFLALTALGLTVLVLVAAQLENWRAALTAAFLLPGGMLLTLVTAPLWLTLSLVGALGARTVLAIHGWQRTQDSTRIGLFWAGLLLGALWAAGLGATALRDELLRVGALLAVFAAAAGVAWQRWSEGSVHGLATMSGGPVVPLGARARNRGTARWILLGATAYVLTAAVLHAAPCWVTERITMAAMLAASMGGLGCGAVLARTVLQRGWSRAGLAVWMPGLLGAAAGALVWSGAAVGALAVVGASGGVVLVCHARQADRAMWRAGASHAARAAAVCGGVLLAGCGAMLWPDAQSHASVLLMVSLGLVGWTGVGLCLRRGLLPVVRGAGLLAVLTVLGLMAVAAWEWERTAGGARGWGAGQASEMIVPTGVRAMIDGLGARVAWVTVAPGSTKTRSAWYLDLEARRWDVIVLVPGAEPLSVRAARRVVARAERALLPGGRLLVADPGHSSEADLPGGPIARAAWAARASGGVAHAAVGVLEFRTDAGTWRLLACGSDVGAWLADSPRAAGVQADYYPVRTRTELESLERNR
ncbi:MAG: hypothetical protein IPM18_07235 [Phycisphaerales bacterium]|nr:hypothetical protein [Phycisphaerales bacterium]